MAARKAKETGKVFRVKTKDPTYCGVGAGGVQFAYGQAEVNEGWVLQWYREHGYTVEPIEAPEAPAE